jgi:hypothetical protein
MLHGGGGMRLSVAVHVGWLQRSVGWELSYGVRCRAFRTLQRSHVVSREDRTPTADHGHLAGAHLGPGGSRQPLLSASGRRHCALHVVVPELQKWHRTFVYNLFAYYLPYFLT